MFKFLNIITILCCVFSGKEPHSRMTGSLFERLNKQIINPNYVLPTLNSENNIKGCDCRVVTDYVSFNKNTLLENIYKFEKLNQLLVIKSHCLNEKNRIYNLSPETVSYITKIITLPINGESIEFENKILKTHIPNTKNAVQVFVIEPLYVASCKNIKNGGLFNDFLIDI